MDSPQAHDVLEERLAHGPPILIDGGTGTEIERMGAPMDPGAWSARASLTDPDIVRNVHEAFLSSGAEMIIANTYPANYHVMAAAGLSHEFETANKQALQLAHEARKAFREKNNNRPIWIAGSMSTTTFTPGLDQAVIKTAHARAQGYRAQAKIIADGGADLITLEMMRDAAETRLCLDAALATGLPVWLGLSVEQNDSELLTFHGSEDPFVEGVEQILAKGEPPQAVGVMHSELTITPEAVRVLSTLWDGPLFAYPHHGIFEMPHWRFDNTLSPDEFADAAEEWIRRGATAVGGCCGIRPAHIAALRSRLDGLREA